MQKTVLIGLCITGLSALKIKNQPKGWFLYKQRENSYEIDLPLRCAVSLIKFAQLLAERLDLGSFKDFLIAV